MNCILPPIEDCI